MEHRHKYDKDGKQLCCTQEEKINLVADKQLKKEHKEVGCCATDEPKHNDHSDDDGHDHSSGNDSTFKMFLPAIIVDRNFKAYSGLLKFACQRPLRLSADHFSRAVPVFFWVLACASVIS